MFNKSFNPWNDADEIMLNLFLPIGLIAVYKSLLFLFYPQFSSHIDRFN